MLTMRRAVVGPQCPELFAVKTAPRGKMPDAVSLTQGLTTAPTRGDAHHV